MLAGIVSSLIAAVIVGIVAVWWRSTWLREITDAAFLIVAPFMSRRRDERPLCAPKFRKKVIRLLLRDQSKTGPHRGQFGRSTALSETAKWQTSGSRENLRLKPRMYLTFWPTVILRRHAVGKRSATFALLNVRRLFVGNRILVAQSASPAMSPHRDPVLVSYRHTMAAALILAEFDPWNSITRAVLDAMLDSKNDWQHPSGGWRQVNEDFQTTDLWASAYAAKLLLRCLSSNGLFSTKEQQIAGERLNATLSFITSEWTSNTWGSGKLSPEEAAPLLFIELMDVLKDRHPKLLTDSIKKFRSWLSPAGDLSVSYLTMLESIPHEQLYARMAYVFYLSERESGIWRKLFGRLSNQPLQKLLSADLAFVLDMSFARG